MSAAVFFETSVQIASAWAMNSPFGPSGVLPGVVPDEPIVLVVPLGAVVVVDEVAAVPSDPVCVSFVLPHAAAAASADASMKVPTISAKQRADRDGIIFLSLIHI